MQPSSLPLSPPEARCLELAWEAWGRGTVPVGAVITGAGGEIVYEGRSRIYEQTAPAGELANSLLAHAEINALARLDPQRRHERLRITTSLEPCPLCLGAIGMATVGTLAYLGADPYGGAVGLHQPTPHLERVALRVIGPRADAVGLLASALHVAFYLGRDPQGHVVTVHTDRAPHVVAAARRLVSAGAPQLAGGHVPLEQCLTGLLAALGDEHENGTR
jgi:tRNA(Arg) A34 adenosine deaminase TadA